VGLGERAREITGILGNGVALLRRSVAGSKVDRSAVASLSAPSLGQFQNARGREKRLQENGLGTRVGLASGCLVGWDAVEPATSINRTAREAEGGL
jgi:hypothetical protein